MKLSSLVVAVVGFAWFPSNALSKPGTPGSTQDPSRCANQLSKDTDHAFLTSSFFSLLAFPPFHPLEHTESISSSNVDAFAPSHLEMDYFVDFETQTTFGTVTHHLTVLEADTTTVFMDVWDAVEVSKAEYWVDPSANASTAVGRQGLLADEPLEVAFNISTPNSNTGKAVGINVPAMLDGTNFYLRLTYRSLPETTALSWMTPEQTAGKEKPFVYSLCQLNFCRDWAPMMDTPSQKITYNASITAPNGYVVSMSGNETGRVAYNETWTTTTFECALKIPSYQIALVVGDLEMVDLGGRIKVFAEKPYIEAAAAEFEDLPGILAEAEAYLTPYIWGNYSIMVMPPSFPWGGMEHINANLVSHTLITGDKSMLSTAIHEITHSWFGNDVGCKNWNHFWINEGMNVFMERKILGSYYGEEFAKIDYSTGNTSMYYDDMVGHYGLNNTYSSLFPDIGDDDPENSFSGVPYEKGSQFMYYIESFLGQQAMQTMLRAYIRQFTQQAIDQEEFQQWYYGWLEQTFPENATKLIELSLWDTWVFEPGLGPVQIDVATTALEDADALALEYIELNTTSSPLSFSDYNEFYPKQQLAFIQKLANSEGVTVNLVEYVDNDLAITESSNPSVKTEWYILGIKVGYDAVLDPAYVWLGEQGRTAYCTPIYRALIDSGRCDLAAEWFQDYRASYNTYVVGGVTRALEACKEGATMEEEPVTPEEEEELEVLTEEAENNDPSDEAPSSAVARNLGGILLGSLAVLALA
ncbi:Leukotriene A-4 hydrolase [Seminavis robusta]|uniref:Leukotriene A-4 hydrolase n=1 Tax=Seminavis robusta TaxID=568900 RepID=A0A9N8ETU2_9STRA|nr:Leukotriene A-4 hydrolase [Seminavis robusta]|eukprot:Sro1947_g307120.1 Leukotriene A-4 hydrolase (754) ;mRNA; f:4556-7075